MLCPNLKIKIKFLFIIFQVHIGEITPDLNVTTVTFLGMEKGNGTMLTRDHNTSDVDYNWVGTVTRFGC